MNKLISKITGSESGVLILTNMGAGGASVFSRDHSDCQSFGVFANPHCVIYTPNIVLPMCVFTASKARSIPNPKITGQERGGEINPARPPQHMKNASIISISQIGFHGCTHTYTVPHFNELMTPHRVHRLPRQQIH